MEVDMTYTPLNDTPARTVTFSPAVVCKWKMEIGSKPKIQKCPGKGSQLIHTAANDGKRSVPKRVGFVRKNSERRGQTSDDLFVTNSILLTTKAITTTLFVPVAARCMVSRTRCAVPHISVAANTVYVSRLAALGSSGR